MASKLSVVFNEDDENHLIGNDDEGWSCPTCGNPCDPETYTIRVFIGGTDGLSYTQFKSFIPFIDDITNYSLLVDYNYAYGKTEGYISIRQFDKFVGIHVSFEDDGHIIQIYAKHLDHIKDLVKEVIQPFHYQVGSEWKHQIDSDDLLEAIQEIYEKDSEAAKVVETTSAISGGGSVSSV